MKMKKPNPLKEKSFKYAVRIIELFKYLRKQKKEFILSAQILRSGTSIGANIREAQNAQSKTDFIHKLFVSQKECDENLYWLELLEVAEFISKDEFDSLSKDANELLMMLRSSIITARRNLNSTKK